MMRILTRLSLVGLITFGGYMVFSEQQIVRICKNEIKSLEKSFEARLDPQKGKGKRKGTGYEARPQRGADRGLG